MEKTNYGVVYEFLADFDASSIEVATRMGRWASIIEDWMNTDAKAVKISLKNADEKKLCRNSICAYIKNHNLDWVVYPERATYNIYVVRA